MTEIFAFSMTMLVLCLLIIVYKVISRYADMKIEELSLQREILTRKNDDQGQINELKIARERRMYSESLLKYSRERVAEISTILFQQFVDSHKIGKVTKSQVVHIVDATAKRVKENMQYENILFDETLFTQEYLEGYIIDLSVEFIKGLLQKAVINYDEEEE